MPPYNLSRYLFALLLSLEPLHCAVKPAPSLLGTSFSVQLFLAALPGIIALSKNANRELWFQGSEP